MTMQEFAAYLSEKIEQKFAAGIDVVNLGEQTVSALSAMSPEANMSVAREILNVAKGESAKSQGIEGTKPVLFAMTNAVLSCARSFVPMPLSEAIDIVTNLWS
jgi:hypothetical protein